MKKLCQYCEENPAVEGDVACQKCLDHFAEEDAHRTCIIVGCEIHVPAGHDFCERHAEQMRYATPVRK